MGKFARIARHTSISPKAASLAFPKRARDAIAAATVKAEESHCAELRFAVESSIDVGKLLRGMTPRERAIEVFSAFGMDATERRNGVLLYVCMADRAVEIVADQGIDSKAEQADWDRICQALVARFAEKKFEQGVVEAIVELGRVLAEHYGKTQGGGVPGANEIPDSMVVL